MLSENEFTRKRYSHYVNDENINPETAKRMAQADLRQEIERIKAENINTLNRNRDILQRAAKGQTVIVSAAVYHDREELLRSINKPQPTERIQKVKQTEKISPSVSEPKKPGFFSSFFSNKPEPKAPDRELIKKPKAEPKIESKEPHSLAVKEETTAIEPFEPKKETKKRSFFEKLKSEADISGLFKGEGDELKRVLNKIPITPKKTSKVTKSTIKTTPKTKASTKKKESSAKYKKAKKGKISGLNVQSLQKKYEAKYAQKPRYRENIALKESFDRSDLSFSFGASEIPYPANTRVARARTAKPNTQYRQPLIRGDIALGLNLFSGAGKLPSTKISSNRQYSGAHIAPIHNDNPVLVLGLGAFTGMGSNPAKKQVGKPVSTRVSKAPQPTDMRFGGHYINPKIEKEKKPKTRMPQNIEEEKLGLRGWF